MKIKFATAAAALACVPVAGNAAAIAILYGSTDVDGDAYYLAAGLPLADISGFAPHYGEIVYPDGFSSAGVTITART